MSSRRAYLSKSRLMSARQCLKRLHLEVNRPDLAEYTAKTEALFRTGNAVGDIARTIYGGDNGRVIPYSGGLSHALRKTARLLAEGPVAPIFEATFQHGGLLVRVDVLLPDDGGWRMVEVKASTSVKEEHLFDCAAQRYVVEGAGHKLNAVALAHVDNGFVYGGDGDYSGLLVETDLSSRTSELLPAVQEWIALAKSAAAGSEPDIDVGVQCYQPYACPFVRHCWPAHDGYPVQGLGGGRAKLGAWISEGLTDVRDVPASRLTEKQRRIQAVTKSGRAELLPGASDFVRALPYPRYYLDFETVMPAIPIWAGTRPYETLPVQWSCHYEPAPGEIGHAEFLDLTGEPPMRRLAESLLRALGREGPVLMYTRYEEKIISELIQRFPDLAAPLQAVVARLVDLHPVVQQNYYHPAMAGSWSLKAVLPTISDDLHYSELEGIQEGMAASEAYLEAVHPATETARKAELKEQLLRYCRLDTDAMARLVHFLAGSG